MFIVNEKNHAKNWKSQFATSKFAHIPLNGTLNGILSGTLNVLKNVPFDVPLKFVLR